MMVVKLFSHLQRIVTNRFTGELAERSKATVLKTVDLVIGPGVRIPHSSPNINVAIVYRLGHPVFNRASAGSTPHSDANLRKCSRLRIISTD